MKAPLIFDVKRASTSDGPGIRTVLFFKGCNLDCFWCHNPEGKSPLAERAFFAKKCIGCGSCQRVCNRGAAPCSVCGNCTEACPTSAVRIYGRGYTAEELISILRSDLPFFEATGGGVTLSGGECMLYPEFVARIARDCREAGISVAVDTAGCVPYESFEQVIPYTDLFLYDIKCLDPALHRRGTGVDNALILNNLDRLLAARKRVTVRVPVIPGFNEGAEVERIKEYCKERGITAELLPYHPFGEDKKAALKAAK